MHIPTLCGKASVAATLLICAVQQPSVAASVPARAHRNVAALHQRLVADAQQPRSEAERDQLFMSWLPRFHQTWKSDSCVQQAQAWDDYAGWVHTFYYQSGGWFDTMDGIVARVTNAAARTRISSELATLGRRVAGEWSKDNSCRRIDTFGPYGIGHFAGILQAGLNRETGDGTSVQAAVNEVNAEVDQLMRAQ